MARDDGRGWWYVPPRSRTVTTPVAAILLAMGASSLVRAGPTYAIGWLLAVLGAGVSICAVASQRSDDAARGRSVRRVVLQSGAYLLVVLVAVGLNVGLASALYR